MRTGEDLSESFCIGFPQRRSRILHAKAFSYYVQKTSRLVIIKSVLGSLSG
jgi:hypothetical protein